MWSSRGGLRPREAAGDQRRGCCEAGQEEEEAAKPWSWLCRWALLLQKSCNPTSTSVCLSFTLIVFYASQLSVYLTLLFFFFFLSFFWVLWANELWQKPALYFTAFIFTQKVIKWSSRPRVCVFTVEVLECFYSSKRNGPRSFSTDLTYKDEATRVKIDWFHYCDTYCNSAGQILLLVWS